jgi:phosphatidylserine decarboxylase
MVRDGYIYGLVFLALAVAVFGLTGSLWLAFIPVVLAAFFLWFFRDPERIIPSGPGLIVSPGDGVVTEIAAIHTPEGPRQRISIFLSVFNVHVNRSPIAGVLTHVRYQKGKYLNAMNPASTDQNEQNIATVRGEGYEGDSLARGQRVGLIKFGSRVDVLLPAEAEVRVKLRETVHGGSTVLAQMPQGDRP